MKNNLSLAVQKIKDSISALDVGEAIGLEIRRGRCKCPIHGGNDFNCVLYSGDRGYYCHVCKSGGDVIKFVQEYYGTSFKDTVEWLNSTFSLGMDIDSPMSPEAIKQAELAQRKRKEERELREWAERMQFDMMLMGDRILEKLEEQRDANLPKTPDETWNRKFCEAIRLIPVAKRFVQECMMKCAKEK